ncbi:hypothetical protein [Actinoplanes sp. NPDC051851]|uniref:hypothetical protein n=1 Tax=Actinoplanes sp. NPDC051851 TaxID=3154753 RepID=UPI003443ACB1
MLALGAGIMALLCLGGVGVFVALYDDATEIKRTAPDAVADSFIRAYLVNRDDNEAQLYACSDGFDYGPISSLRTEILNREKKFDVTVSVTWSTLTLSSKGQSETRVSTDLTIAGFSDGVSVSRRTENWSFDLVDHGGWRVCGAVKSA